MTSQGGGSSGHSTPAPTPSRANYGFVLYLASRTCLLVYLGWSLFGGTWGADHFLYLPQPYWAVALPVHLMVTLALFAMVFYPALNLCLTPAPEDPRILRDEYSLPPPDTPHRKGIPQPYDLPPSLVSRTLYARID